MFIVNKKKHEYVKFNDKVNSKNSADVVLGSGVFIFNFEDVPVLLTGVSIVDFDQLSAGWVVGCCSDAMN